MPTKNRQLVYAIAAAGALLAMSAGSVSAQTAAEFYKGRTMNIIIGFAPGGGYNHYMRALMRHMVRHIPGKPTMIARNMPGAGSLVAANYIYNTAPKDGSVMGIFASSTLFSKMMGEKKANFEISKFNWIGTIDKTVGTCTVWHKSGVNSFEDLYRRVVVFGASGPSAVNATHAWGFNALLGTRVKVINGYAGSTGVWLAMQRGEVDGGCGFALSSLKVARRKPWKEGALKVIIQTGRDKSPDLKGVPHLYDMAKTKDDKKVMDLIYGTHILGRPVSAPPGVPADRLKVLRAAFDATMKDPKFLAEAKKLRLSINPFTGVETEKMVAQFSSYPKNIVARATKALAVGGITRVKLKKFSGKITVIKKRRVTFTNGSGKTLQVKIHPRRTKLKIAGKKAKTQALKVDLTCSLSYFAAKDLAPRMACK